MPEKKAENQMKKDIEMKESLLKKKGNILHVLDLSRIQDQVDAKYIRPHSPEVDSQINEMFKSGIQRHVPLKWDYNSKKWMGPDQIVVETAF